MPPSVDNIIGAPGTCAARSPAALMNCKAATLHADSLYIVAQQPSSVPNKFGFSRRRRGESHARNGAGGEDTLVATDAGSLFPSRVGAEYTATVPRLGPTRRRHTLQGLSDQSSTPRLVAAASDQVA